MKILRDLNEAVARQAENLERVAGDLWSVPMSVERDAILEVCARRLRAAALTLDVMAGASRDARRVCRIVEDLAGV